MPHQPSNLPPGVTESMIPGNVPDAWVNAVIILRIPIDRIDVDDTPSEKMAAATVVFDDLCDEYPGLQEYSAVVKWEDEHE